MERYNLVVVGAGSGGLVVAAGGATLGARVALVEKHALPPAPAGGTPVRAMGGDCLHWGCVPSKALLAAAKAAEGARRAGRFAIRGVSDPGPQDLGVDVLIGEGRLVSPHEVAVGGTTVRGRHVVLATGSREKIPDVPGLAEAGFLTNETVFSLRELPRRLLVIGAGPVGVEFAQAFRRLGAAVTIVCSSPHVCPKEDADAAAVLAQRLRDEGVVIHEGATESGVAVRGGSKVVTVVGKDGAAFDVEVDEILVAAGRRPNVEGLGLESVGVRTGRKGIEIDARCRTSVPSVWAIGDVAGPYLFTHWASHQAGIVLRNTLAPVALARYDAGSVPWVTYTEPEIARVGLGEDQARARGVPHRVFRASFAHNDRALCEGSGGEHFAKVLVDGKGRILGATIVHPHAGELLGEIVLAKKNGLPLSALGSVIHAYPTLSEIHGALAREALRSSLTPGKKAFLTRLAAFLRR